MWVIRDKSAAYLRQFNRNLWILSLGWLVSAVGFAAAIPFIGIYFHSEFGMSITEIGIFFGVMAIVRSLFQAIGGEVSDRMQRRRLLILSQVARAAVFVVLAGAVQWHWGFWWCGACLLVNSIFGAIFQPVANAMVSDILPEEKRLDGYAITRTAGNLGWAIGPAVGGFMAATSYALLFLIAAVATFASALIFRFFLQARQTEIQTDRFRMRDIIAIKDDPQLAVHSVLIFLLYLVVAQLILPFSVYAVEIVGISEVQLGMLYMLNGGLVVFFQILMTRFLARYSLTTQLAMGGLLYAVGYTMVGAFAGVWYFAGAIAIVTVGEMAMSPPSLTLTSRLAPAGRMGRYMGIYGFFVAAGWSFGPLYGGVILDCFKATPAVAWLVISSLAIVSAVGYLLFGRRLSAEINGNG
ncbi:MAG: MFS transporter [bacterium]